MSRYNKLSASALGGALAIILGQFWHPDPIALQAAQLLLTSALVYAIPNIGE